MSLNTTVADYGWSNHFAKDTITATFIALHLYAMRFVDIRIPAWVSSFAVKGAAQTFTLYLIHFPIILIVRSLLDETSSLQTLFYALIAIAVATLFVSSQTESRRLAFLRMLASRLGVANR
jgi:peptidoglycan/LPS O-acetylase OafA/YrhL